MRHRLLVIVFRLALIVALAASAALVVDYATMGDPAFCGAASGCNAVRTSPYSKLFGISLPDLGLAAYASLFLGSLLARYRIHYIAIAAVSALGAVMGLVLLVLQSVVIGAICGWCVAVDMASIAAAVMAIIIARDVHKKSPSDIALEGLSGFAVTGAWLIAAVATIGLPFVWGKYPVVATLPAEIAPLQVQGKLTIVGFTDFQCPFCRKMHADLREIEHELGDRMQYIRRLVPLQSHKGALPAAKAYLCVPEGQREQAADLLYEASERQLTQDILRILAPLNLDTNLFETCFSAHETQAQIDADKDLFRRVGGTGLPFMYVGKHVVKGYNPERLHEMLALERSGESFGLPLAWLFVALGAFCALAVAVSLRGRNVADRRRTD